jgi:hypothetical protein
MLHLSPDDWLVLSSALVALVTLGLVLLPAPAWTGRNSERS